MAGERLPVNIFQGVLPGAYLFLDDGSDDSKWINSVASPFQSIVAGDTYGYNGKGLRFTYDQALGGIQTARRSILPVGNVGTERFFGFILRSNLYSLTPIQAAGIISTITITFPVTYWTDLGGGRWEMKEAFANTTFADLYWAPSTSFHSDISVVGSQVTRIWPTTIPQEDPWYRISFMMNGLTPALSIVNSLHRIPGSVLVPSALWPTNSIQVSWQFGGLPGVDVYFDLDQIWISDTENRV